MGENIFLGNLVFTWFTTITSPRNEVNELSEGILSDDVVGGKADLVGDGVLVGSKVSVKVNLDVVAPCSPVNGGSSDDQGLSKVKTKGGELNGVENKARDGNLVSDDVDEKRGTSLELESSSLDAGVSLSGEISLWNGLSAEWTSINVSRNIIGGGNIYGSELQFENSGEEESIDVNIVAEG